MTTRATRSPRRRTVVALAVVLAVLAGFIVRLVDIQVVSAEEYNDQASSYSLGASRTLYGSRGSITDENGQTLAGSVLEYDCQLDPLLITQIDELVAEKKSKDDPWSVASGKIATITGQTAEDVQKIVADAIANDPSTQYAVLKRGLSTEQYRDLMALGAPYTSYMSCPQRPARTYPDGAVAGNIVGFMGVDGDPLAGLEMSQNSCLASTNGSLTFEKGKYGVTIPGTEVSKPAVDGGTLQLTINRDLQWYLQQLAAEQGQNMGAKRVTITVEEVKTGKIRAAAEWPTVDPNNVDASTVEDRNSSIFTGTFEPGSTFKALTAATVIDAGGQSPTSTVVASSQETFANGARVRDAFVHPAYDYTLAGVLIDSSNAGISKFSERVNKETRFDYFQKFGIGQGSAIDFVGELRGDLRPATQWDNQTMYNTSFGQGLTTTVPELVGAYSAIANGGTRMPLSLVESCTKADGTVVEPELPEPTQVISPESSAQVRQLLENVALQANYSKQIEIPGYRLAVKTGTGEKTDGNGGYKQGLYFTTMIGFAPADDPQYVVAVTFDEPTAVRSSAANAPAFQKAMTQVLKTYRVMPSTSQATLLPKFG
ncbi:cell division protein FtsI [Microbacterium sp. Root61]|uniref:peptidoglycan D,D-transpeptidase FtsI family protein n=1 Tax=Microbacterium sp. Root61 TaxID=1736570 RepID=UPI0006FD1F74|nr:penicillin-binding protein 2 [Microbacterium sp. Root61]KRA23063.1 cell division protein FtsI [Microbacterium sp. Root61]